MDFSFSYEGNKLSYTCFGKGKKIFLAFHGFAQNKYVFRNFITALGKDAKIYSFDLFMHGQSVWADKNKKLSKEDWNKIIEKFLQSHEINNFSLLAFSMGGKFALSILENLPRKINQVILIAPDGIKTNFWYNLATLPGWTGNLFKNMVINPIKFQRFARLFQKLKIVDKGLVRFSEGQLKTREQRLRVYYSWIVFSLFRFNIKNIADIINHYNIDLALFIGQHDKIITEKNILFFNKMLKRPGLILLNSGHNSLIEATANYILNK